MIWDVRRERAAQSIRLTVTRPTVRLSEVGTHNRLRREVCMQLLLIAHGFGPQLVGSGWVRSALLRLPHGVAVRRAHVKQATMCLGLTFVLPTMSPAIHEAR